MNFKKPLIQDFKPLEHKLEHTPTVAVVCPACGSEIGLNDIVESSGSIGCVNCR